MKIIMQIWCELWIILINTSLRSCIFVKWTIENVQILQNGSQGEQPLFMEVCICVSTEHECEVQHLNRARVKSCRFRRIARGRCTRRVQEGFPLILPLMRRGETMSVTPGLIDGARSDQCHSIIVTVRCFCRSVCPLVQWKLGLNLASHFKFYATYVCFALKQDLSGGVWICRCSRTNLLPLKFPPFLPLW